MSGLQGNSSSPYILILKVPGLMTNVAGKTAPIPNSTTYQCHPHCSFLPKIYLQISAISKVLNSLKKEKRRGNALSHSYLFDVSCHKMKTKVLF